MASYLREMDSNFKEEFDRIDIDDADIFDDTYLNVEIALPRGIEQPVFG